MKHRLFILYVLLTTVIGTICAAWDDEKVCIGSLCYILDMEQQTAEVTNGDYKTFTSVNIPASVSYDGVEYNVTGIGGVAFSECSKLTSISIPGSVWSIDDCAFSDCPCLTSIVCWANTPPRIAENLFGKRNRSKVTFYVPKKSIKAYKSAKHWKNLRIRSIE